MSTVGSELINEIERVSGVRETYKSLRGVSGVNVEPAIAMMTCAIQWAKDAIESDDPAEAIAALSSLQGFKE